MIGVYAGVFLAITTLIQGWVYGMVVYLAVFVAVTGTVLKPEAISLLRQVSAVIKQNKDVTVVQTEK